MRSDVRCQMLISWLDKRLQTHLREANEIKMLLPILLFFKFLKKYRTSFKMNIIVTTVLLFCFQIPEPWYPPCDEEECSIHPHRTYLGGHEEWEILPFRPPLQQKQKHFRYCLSHSWQGIIIIIFFVLWAEDFGHPHSFITVEWDVWT